MLLHCLAVLFLLTARFGVDAQTFTVVHVNNTLASTIVESKVYEEAVKLALEDLGLSPSLVSNSQLIATNPADLLAQYSSASTYSASTGVIFASGKDDQSSFLTGLASNNVRWRK